MSFTAAPPGSASVGWTRRTRLDRQPARALGNQHRLHTPRASRSGRLPLEPLDGRGAAAAVVALDPLGCDNSSGLPASSFGFAPSPPFALAPRASCLSSARLAEPPVVLSARGAQAVAFTERPIKGGKKGGSIVPNVCLSSKSFSFFTRDVVVAARLCTIMKRPSVGSCEECDHIHNWARRECPYPW